MITCRFATVAPLFANLRYKMGLDRLTRRSGNKVQWPWRPCCLVHNIEWRHARKQSQKTSATGT